MPGASPENLRTNIPKALPSPAHLGTSIGRGLPCPSGWPWAHSRWGWPCSHWLSWPPGRTGTQAAPKGRQLPPHGYSHGNPAGLPFTLLPPRTPSLPPSRGHLPSPVTGKHCWSLLRSTSQRGPAPRSPLPPASNSPGASLLHTHSHSRVHTLARSLPRSHHLHPRDAHSGHVHRQTRVSYFPTRAPAPSTQTTALEKHRSEVWLPLAGSSSRHRPLPSPAPGGHTPQGLDPEALT